MRTRLGVYRLFLRLSPPPPTFSPITPFGYWGYWAAFEMPSYRQEQTCPLWRPASFRGAMRTIFRSIKNTSEVPALPRCRKREFKRNLYSFPFLLSSAFVMCCALSARSNASFRNLFSLPVTIWCVVKPVLTSPKIMQKCETIDYNLRAYVTILSQIKA